MNINSTCKAVQSSPMPFRHVTKDSGRSCSSTGRSRHSGKRWKQIRRASKLTQVHKEHEKSQDFVKVENFYFTKRTGQDSSYTCSVRRRAGPEAFKDHFEDVQASPYLFFHSFLPKQNFWFFLSSDRSTHFVRPVHFYQPAIFSIRPVGHFQPTGLSSLNPKFSTLCPTGRLLWSDRSIFVNFLKTHSLLDRSILLVRPVYFSLRKFNFCLIDRSIFMVRPVDLLNRHTVQSQSTGTSKVSDRSI